MNVFDLFAKITLDTKDFDENLDESGKKVSVFSDMLKSQLVMKGIEVAIKGFAKLAEATANVTKAAVEAYASYEQLVGGVETLFKDSAGVVQQYAAEAYKTAGLSANDYMETVTSFSASLLQSLGGDTEEAADIANRAVIDMSDNANKMGTDMSAIQTAYMGFSKQNYTMLDNLKLGYGGTKTEMERLIKDAAQMTEIQKKLNVVVKEGDMGFANIVNAISVMQESLGIAGTTAKEASTTIQGSLSAAKAAWQNLLVGIADDNADFDTLVDNFVESVGTASENLIPRIEKALKGVGQLIRKLGPVIREQLGPLLKDILPDLIQTGISIIIEVAKAIGENIGPIVDALVKGTRKGLDAVGDDMKERFPALGFLFENFGSKVEGVTVAVLALKAAFAALNMVTGAGSGIAAVAKLFGSGAAAVGATAATGATAGTTAAGIAGAGAAAGVAAPLALAGLTAAGSGLLLGTMFGSVAATDKNIATQQAARESGSKWWSEYLNQMQAGNTALAEIAHSGAIEQWKNAGMTDADIKQIEDGAQSLLEMVAQQKETTAKIAELTEAINNRPIVVTAEIDGKAITEEITTMQAAFERSWGK